jgi:hypothetical protein
VLYQALESHNTKSARTNAVESGIDHTRCLLLNSRTRQFVFRAVAPRSDIYLNVSLSLQLIKIDDGFYLGVILNKTASYLIDVSTYRYPSGPTSRSVTSPMPFANVTSPSSSDVSATLSESGPSRSR